MSEVNDNEIMDITATELNSVLDDASKVLAYYGYKDNAMTLPSICSLSVALAILRSTDRLVESIDRLTNRIGAITYSNN